ncbi:MAG: hypothetical protein ABI307_14515 [Mycobacterium sp.]
MLGAIAIMPSAPVLVPELAGAAAVELAELRAAVTAAAGFLPSHWVAVGAGAADAVFGPENAGTFAGFGVDLAVRLSPRVDRVADLPLCALIAGWVRDRVRPEAYVQVQVCSDPEGAFERGERLRAEIDRSPEPTGVLVLADGANTLTRIAPGGYRPDDVDVQAALDDALVHGDTAALTGLPTQVVGRSAFAMLAGLAGPAPRTAEELYRGAPYGVGYFVGVWRS